MFTPYLLNLSNLGQMFALVRWCAELITQQCRLKVKVITEGHQFEPWIWRPLHCHSAAGDVAVLQTALLTISIGIDTLWAQLLLEAGLGGSVGCAVRLETRRSRVQSRRGRQHSFVEIDHEIFSTVILSLPLIQEGQLSVSGEKMCTILVNRLED